MVIQKKKSEEYIIKKLSNTNTKYCIGRIFSTTNSNQKKKLLSSRFKKKKIKYAKEIVTLNNLNHYRDFISMKDISRIIFFFYFIKILMVS